MFELNLQRSRVALAPGLRDIEPGRPPRAIRQRDRGCVQLRGRREAASRQRGEQGGRQQGLHVQAVPQEAEGREH